MKHFRSSRLLFINVNKSPLTIRWLYFNNIRARSKGQAYTHVLPAGSARALGEPTERRYEIKLNQI